MYIRFTPKQIQKAKEFLKTSTIKVHDIELFQGILLQLDQAFDEHQVNVPKTVQCKPKFEKSQRPSRLKENTSQLLMVEEEKQIESSTDEEIAVLKTPRILQEDDSSVNKKSVFEREKISPPVEDKTTSSPNQELIDDVIPSTADLDKAGLFGVVDRRTTKDNTKSYI